jgi:glucose/arabinose dehydrogenase
MIVLPAGGDNLKRAIYLSCLILGLLLAGCGGSEPQNEGSRPRVGLELIAEGFTSPVSLASPDDGSGRLFVADQRGQIWLVTANGREDEPFLDLSDRMESIRPTYDERGLLGLTMHPDFDQNGRFFVYYSAPLRPGAPEGWDHTSHLSEFRVSESDPNSADPASERILLQMDEPQSNHNGGGIAFGPDGYLYVALGDGGGANDTGLGHPPQGNGQDTSTLLGSILRLDVDGGAPYSVPADNPFVGQEGRDEIWAYGFRNPFRIAFDRGGEGALYVGDVGQNLFEEVDVVTKGGNYGWRIREGRHCFDPDRPNSPPDQCPQVGARGEPLQAPILEYDHDLGISVIGGYLYRGSQMPDLVGHYIFGDWSKSFIGANGKVFDGLPPASGSEAWTRRQFVITTLDDTDLGAFLLSFGQDIEGELYALTSKRPGPLGSTGKVFKLVPPQ